MGKCTIPGCEGTVVREFNRNGISVSQEDIPSPYDSGSLRKNIKKLRGLETVYYCDKCGVMYHHPPKDQKEL